MLRPERLLAMRAARHRQLTLLVVLHPARATVVNTDNLDEQKQQNGSIRFLMRQMCID